MGEEDDETKSRGRCRTSSRWLRNGSSRASHPDQWAEMLRRTTAFGALFGSG